MKRKTIICEHIPPSLDNRLLGDSQDPTVTYEAFAKSVANAAHSQQRSYELNQERRRKKETPRANDTHDRKPGGGNSTKTQTHQSNTGADSKPATVLTARRALTEAEKRVHWDAGTCFYCGKAGHKNNDCPDRQKTPAIKAVKAKEEETSSTEESENE